ncbi:hypothetical protein [Vibrio barjaei]|uniref:hypothetical protein n=1 Tax=Vibrio barjaei TaxID=1676683 RepID=UPI0007BB3E70|nr:hypothetical protein [Vibrio barjaei]OIN25831.1 hypothetical protein AWH66_2016285 [Vibrio barjaei]
MSKVPNPVRGYVTCPVCSETATVHMIGEGKLLAEGEPPKNPRNLGLLYYRCPNCGNSQMSKSVNQYITDHMSEDEPETASASVTLETHADKAQTVIDDNAISTIEAPLISAANDDLSPLPVAANDETAVSETPKASAPKPAPTKLGMKLAIGFVVVLLIIIGLHVALKTKAEQQEANAHE